MKLGAVTRKSFLVAFKTEVTVIAYATLLFGVKLATALFWVMLLGLLLVVSAVDGLVQRTIRRACGGHESASIYHRAKHYGVGLLPSAIGVIYFCWPTAIEPSWIFVPGALVTALMARLQATYYKKYL
jgi:integrating conjugative element membrane protein (TIGR03747 family)